MFELKGNIVIPGNDKKIEDLIKELDKKSDKIRQCKYKINEKIYHIAVEGTIGVGKTSLARILSEEIQGRLVLEEFEDNPFLKEFYQDRKRWAFQTQINFLISRYYQQLRLQQIDMFADKIVSDYMFAKDKLFAQTSLDDNEMILYKKLANIFEKNITPPDLVIFLQSDVDRLMENIKSRGKRL